MKRASTLARMFRGLFISSKAFEILYVRGKPVMNYRFRLGRHTSLGPCEIAYYDLSLALEEPTGKTEKAEWAQIRELIGTLSALPSVEGKEVME